MRTKILLFIFISTCQSLTFLEVVLAEWETWKVSNLKRYSSDTEESFRLKIYMENKAKIERHNHRAHSGQHTYFLKMNKYGDMLHHEFRRTMNGYKGYENRTAGHGATFIKAAHVQSLPKNVDWRQLGAVTKVKDQVKKVFLISFESVFQYKG